jgi:hypothetical protein
MNKSKLKKLTGYIGNIGFEIYAHKGDKPILADFYKEIDGQTVTHLIILPEDKMYNFFKTILFFNLHIHTDIRSVKYTLQVENYLETLDGLFYRIKRLQANFSIE